MSNHDVETYYIFPFVNKFYKAPNTIDLLLPSLVVVDVVAVIADNKIKIKIQLYCHCREYKYWDNEMQFSIQPEVQNSNKSAEYVHT